MIFGRKKRLPLRAIDGELSAECSRILPLLVTNLALLHSGDEEQGDDLRRMVGELAGHLAGWDVARGGKSVVYKSETCVPIRAIDDALAWEVTRLLPLILGQLSALPTSDTDRAQDIGRMLVELGEAFFNWNRKRGGVVGS